ncbi:hypothetical protein [Oceanibacterium hippocampi]|uniref:ACT domain-containing protein n=1 Tax=Oceanibacterium hippocampi TaxID=745714 RepID=A0A1Y5RVS7_9PROT|nr:hypothetical protein [Oceanibacterium hippocampi]SLN26709.1 hypothetical protein OCH7691_00844 [Oceanibacterium hippocampi]
MSHTEQALEADRTAFAPLETGAEAAASPRLTTFLIRGQSEPGMLPRLLELFALRSVVPTRLEASAEVGTLAVRITVPCLGRNEIEHLRLRMAGQVSVETVCIEGAGD